MAQVEASEARRGGRADGEELAKSEQQRASETGPWRVPASLRPTAAGALGDPVLCRWMCGRAIPQLAAI